MYPTTNAIIGDFNRTVDAPVSVEVELVSSLEDQYTGIVVNHVEVCKLYPTERETPVEFQLRAERSRLIALAVAERMAGIRR